MEDLKVKNNKQTNKHAYKFRYPGIRDLSRRVYARAESTVSDGEIPAF